MGALPSKSSWLLGSSQNLGSFYPSGILRKHIFNISESFAVLKLLYIFS